jgi:AAA domain
MTTVLLCKTAKRSFADLSVTERGHLFDCYLRLQSDPSHPGLSLERVSRALSDDVWAARVTQDVRAILLRDGDTWTVLYADHHDAAYTWAERHRAERNRVTGAMQIVETTETIAQRIADDPAPPEAPGLFDGYDDGYLLSLGVPPEWLPALREMKSQEVFLAAIEGLPEDAYERLFQLLAGEKVTAPEPVPADRPALESPDTRRSFAVLDEETMRRILDAPLATWLVYLHPSQERLVNGSFGGPVKVTGSAGTGKTVVAMHRARYLSRQGKRVLLTTFVNSLVDAIGHNLRLLCSSEELPRITVATVHSTAQKLLAAGGERVRVPRDGEIAELLYRSRLRTACPFSAAALRSEWDNVLEPQGIMTWGAYREANRAGRGRALSAADRRRMWAVFEPVIEECRTRHMLDWGGQCRLARELIEDGRARSPYDAVIVDEVQDLREQELRLLAALAGDGADRLMLTGDAGQRIYYGPYSMRALGIDVRGRSSVLRINYRTTEQIRRYADTIVGTEGDDLDGGMESRSGCVSLMQGPAPQPHGFRTKAEQYEFIAAEIRALADAGLDSGAVAVFVRSNAGVRAIYDVLSRSGLSVRRQTDRGGSNAVSVECTAPRGWSSRSCFWPMSPTTYCPRAMRWRKLTTHATAKTRSSGSGSSSTSVSLAPETSSTSAGAARRAAFWPARSTDKEARHGVCGRVAGEGAGARVGGAARVGRGSAGAAPAGRRGRRGDGNLPAARAGGPGPVRST